MNDIRRTILWVIFGFSMVLLWDQWQVHSGRQATFFTAPKAATNTAAPGAAGGPVALATAADVPAASSGSGAAAPVAGVAAVPAGGVASVSATGAPAKRERVEVSTDVLKLAFDSEGGSLVRAELVQHPDIVDHKANMVLLDESRDRAYVAQTGLIGPAGAAFPTHKTPMALQAGPRALAEGSNELVLVFESADLGGVKLIKRYTLRRGAYDLKVTHEVLNTGTAAVQPQLYVQLVRDGNKPAGESSFYSTFTGPAFYNSVAKYQKVEFSDIEKNKASFEKSGADGYVAMVQHYFASAWALPDGVQREFFARKVDTNLFAAGMITALPAVAPGERKALDATLFVGPQEEKRLESIAPGLELVKDYGWLTILSKPLYWLLDKIYSMIGNWGWAIVLLVVLLKAAFYWLNASAYRSMAKMKAVNPRIMEMRERLKDNPQQMQQEMMKMYREEKVNPVGGCLPIVIQIPVFIALYWVLLSTVEMRNAPWIGWVHDLASPDPFFILPVLMTASSLFQVWLNPTPPDPMQAKMMWFMPLAFGVMFFFFPAGLVLYWLTNNILSIAQQWLINRQLGVN
jgi:YidC/Oxa1 family membrane protein insertase